ncbi:MAG TPA: glycosyltransferase [Solirubrobacteraceae bacterium]
MIAGVGGGGRRSATQIDGRAISRVLVVSPRAPWPPRGGLELRPASLLLALADLGLEVGLATFAARGGELMAPGDLRVWVAETNADGARPNANLLDWVKTPDGHATDQWWTPRARAAVARALADFDPQLVILDGLWTRRVIPLVADGTGRRVVLCAHNVEGALTVELAHSSAEEVPSALRALVTRRTADIEGSVVAGVDQVWACSNHDAGLFGKHYADCAPVSVIPNVVPIPPARHSTADLEHPLLLFVGTLGYRPNADAAEWLATELLPRLSATGLDARLRVIGSGASAKLRGLARGRAVEITGYVDDLDAHLLEAAVVALPFVAGGGTRFKALEAFANRIPVVSSAKGIEGLEARAGVHYLAAETAVEFASAIAKTCSDRPRRAALIRHAYALVQTSYSQLAMREAVATALAALAHGAGRVRSR